MSDACPLCQGTQWREAYAGAVRRGKFGETVDGTVLECGACGLQMLAPAARSTGSYSTGEYRELLGQQTSADGYLRIHDPEQLAKAPLLEGLDLRGNVVADVGTGGGSFLDLVKGQAAVTVAIDPAEHYHGSLRERGHVVFGSVEQALKEWRGRVHLATGFSVLEHVEDPVSLLAGMRDLLCPGGTALVSTPNRRDVLLDQAIGAYQSFFYRTVHTYYFDAGSLEQAARRAGFGGFRARYVQRFGFANFMGWVRDGRPTGNTLKSPFGPAFEAFWKAALEGHGKSDYLYAYLTP